VCVQAIKDAEADERIADQLAALQITLSQLAEHESAVDGSADTEADTTGGTKNHRPDSSDKVSCFYLGFVLLLSCFNAAMSVSMHKCKCLHEPCCARGLASMGDALLLDLLERKQCQSMTFTHQYTVQCQENGRVMAFKSAGECCKTAAFHPVCDMLEL